MTASAAQLAATTQIQRVTGSNLLNLMIVDDDRAVRKALQDIGLSFGFTTFVADSAEHAFRLLEAQVIDVLLLDLRLPGASGLEALREIRQRWPDVIVVIVTGYGTVHSAVHAMKNGAYDFVTKPFTGEVLKALFERVAGLLQLKTENRVLRERINSTRGFGNLVGRAPQMEKLYRIIAKAAFSAHPVLILGEGGSGKEMVAHSIHSAGPSADKPFIPIDCSSLSPALLEVELFGQTRAVLRGTPRSSRGLLSIAEGGTVLLGEVGAVPVDLQARLVRAIQEKVIREAGSAKSTSIHVRILATTSRDLEPAVSQGTFRKDLFSCLNILSLRIPPLRERRQDIPLLAAHFLERISRSGVNERTLSDDALRVMLGADWPGNVRELEDCLERACVVSSGPMVQAWNLPPSIHGRSESFSGPEDRNIIPITELERQAILSTISQTNGDKLMAARLLGIGKTTLYRKLKEYGGQGGSLQGHTSP